MRYTSSPPHAFRNRIAKSIGVLVAAALVAVLGLPVTAQAQNISRISVISSDMVDESLEVAWGGRTNLGTLDRWIVTFTEPGTGDELILVGATSTTKNPTSSPYDGDGTNVIYRTTLNTSVGMTTMNASLSLADAMVRVFNDGVWEAQVTACFSKPMTASGEAAAEASASDRVMRAVCAGGTTESVAGAAKTYLHGVPMMPMNLDASMIPGGVALTWMHPAADDADYGHMGYEYAMDDGRYMELGKTGSKVVSDVKSGEHMFHVRAVGSSDSDRNTKMDEIFSAVATITYMMPMPTPTLTESATLLLGLMLMGGGMYYTRRRQSGGLTHA